MANAYNHGSNWYRGHVHPAAVYGSTDKVQTDTAVAYTRKNGKINARIVVNTKDKLMARGYGHYKPLVRTLEHQGYTQVSNALVGARIRRIEDAYGNGYILPYVDAGTGPGGGYLYVAACADDYKLWELVDDRDDADYSTYRGYENKGVTDEAEDDRGTCDDCGNSFDEDDLTTVEGGELICPRCLERHYVEAYTGRHQRWVRHLDNVYYCEDTDEYYTVSGIDYHDLVWDVDGDLRHDSYVQSTSRGYVDSTYAVELDETDASNNRYAHPHDVTTTHDGRTIHEDDAVEVEWGDDTYTLYREDNPADYLPSLEETEEPEALAA
jgi:hypothetical protein